MDTNPDRSDWPFDQPALYQICLQGSIPENWLDRLDGMTVSIIRGSAAQAVTTLSGEMVDQAALAGVLRTIYELHLPVISVTRIELSSRKRP
jgi:hypothetical protein